MKIISGGQFGADLGGLEAGLFLGLETGGWCPKGYRTENGSNPELVSKYHLIEDANWEYPPRTEKNILNSDGTIIFGRLSERGSQLTSSLCHKLKKPCFVVQYPAPDSLMFRMRESSFIVWLVEYNVEVLNVAGNRESKNIGIQEFVKNWLVKLLSD